MDIFIRRRTFLYTPAQHVALPIFGCVLCAGANGTNGINGTDGINGTNGVNGTDGLSAWQIWQNVTGSNGTEADFIASLQGAKWRPRARC